MTDKQFSVHKSMVLSNRKALALYLFKIDRAHDVPQIMAQLVDLDEFQGTRISLEVVTNEISLLAHLLQEDYLGLKVINLINVDFLPLYQGIKLCLDPLLKANIKIPFIVICRLVARYFKVITESIQVRLIEEKNLLRLEFSPSMPEQVNHHQIDGVILAVHKILAAFSSVKPTKLTLSYRQSSHGIEIYKQLFGISAELSSATNSLYYALKTNRNFQSNSISVDELAMVLDKNFFIGPLHNMLDKEFPDLSYAARCQHILITIMGLSEPTREQVAQVLNMSVSSLQRRLREEGISFQQILLTTRKMMADRYLIQQNLSATDVAFLLGYQSSSHFFKAFKGWYSMTPMVYQKLHRGDS
ncbi:helix-turn-helix transcriptional regulator [Psychrobacter sp. DAB_AL62B]|uniref:helix-turn-helix transcriptional regulator n=1 Tax=Psychrobacter sp. DAB_AL62B TaxID=1028420 RepID=UPI002381092D|nr:helix-turn-helix transcriptional regulator [Psychrobacter sp. DAB_AL62B]